MEDKVPFNYHVSWSWIAFLKLEFIKYAERNINESKYKKAIYVEPTKIPESGRGFQWIDTL